MITRYSRWPLSRKILLIGTLTALLSSGGLIGYTVYATRDNAMAEANARLAEQNAQLTTMLHGTFELRKAAANRSMATFEVLLGGQPSLSGKMVKTGDTDLPEMLFGTTPINGNTGVLERLKTLTPDTEPGILVKHGDTFYRADTLLKVDGKSSIGQPVNDADPYVAPLKRGEAWTGLLVRNNHAYMLAQKPLRNAAGEVIGALTVRMDTTAEVAIIRDAIKKIRIGDTGYSYVLQPLTTQQPGAPADALFLVHPMFEGKKASEIDQRSRNLVSTIMANPEGKLSYEWAGKDGQPVTKLANMTVAKDWQWVIVSGARLDEFVAQSARLRNELALVASLFGALSLVWFVLIMRRELRPVGELSKALRELGEGNLTTSAPEGCEASRNEFHGIGRSINQAAASMRRLVHQIQGTSTSLVDVTHELVGSAEQAGAAADEQSSTASAMAAGMEQISVSISQVAQNAQEAGRLAESVVHTAADNIAVVDKAIDTLDATAREVAEVQTLTEALANSNARIATITGAIRDIAEQTNLLALNAAIEAARAGEQGRGFAVVADEVRKLAERTTHATVEIADLLGAVSNQTAQVVDKVSVAVGQASLGAEQSGYVKAALESLLTEVNRSSRAISDIARSAQEQDAAGQEIARKVEIVAVRALQSQEMTGHTQHAAGTLKTLADQVNLTLQQFRL